MLNLGTLYTYLLSLVFLLGIPILSKGQTFIPDQFTTQDGLPSNTIYAMDCDPGGYLWISTKNGISRYNGQHFTGFTHPAMRDQDIIRVHAHPDSLLMGFLNLSRELILISQDTIAIWAPKRKETFEIYDFQFTDSNTVWIWGADWIDSDNCAKRSLSLYSLSGERLLFNVGEYDVGQMELKLENGRLFGAGGHLVGLDENFQEVYFVSLAHSPDLQKYTQKGPQAPFFVRNQLVKNDSTLYINLFHPDKKNPQKAQAKVHRAINGRISPVHIADLPLQANAISLIMDTDGSFWLGTDQGLFHIDMYNELEGRVISHFLPEKEVNCLLKDREGNLWIGTNQDGLFLLSSDTYPIFTFDLLDIHGEGPQTLTISDHTIWGIDQSGTLIGLKQDDSYDFTATTNLANFADVYPGPDGKIVATSNVDLVLLDPQSGKYKSWNSYSFSGDQKPIECIKDLVWIDDQLFFGTCHGLRHIDVGTNRKEFLKYGRTMSLHWDSSAQKLWFGHSTGVFTYSKIKGVEKFTDREGQSLNSFAYAITQTDNGDIFFGTHGQGLWCLHENRLKNLNQTWYLPFLSYTDLLPVGEWLWATSEQGLLKINLSTGKFIPIKFNGFEGEPFHLTFFGGYIWLATSKGIIKIHPDQPTSQPKEKKLYLESFAAINKDGEVKHGYILPYSYNEIKLEFSTPTYSEPLQFYFRINDNSTWQVIESSPLRLLGLRAGDYSIEIKASNLSGDTSSKILKVAFTILPPLWERLEFILLMSLLLGVGIFLLVRNIFRRRIKRFKEKASLMRKMELLQVQALQAQMNPHFTFNALNAIQGQVLREDTLSAVNFLADFAQVIRKTLDMVDSPFISVEQEITYLKTYIRLEILRLESSIQVIWNIDEHLSLHKLFIPPMLIQPLVENAFKYGLSGPNPNPVLVLSIKESGSYLSIQVSDNGPGLSPNNNESHSGNTHQSKGIQLIRDRLRLTYSEPNQYGTLTVEDMKELSAPQQTGVRATINIPFSQCLK